MAKVKTRRPIYTLDAETDPFKFNELIQPFCWGIYCEDDFDFFWGDEKQIKKQLVAHLKELPEKSIIYAHNGGKFDFHFLIELLDPDMMIINGRIATCTMFGGQIELRDSFLLLPVALGSYDKIEIDYDKFKKENREKHKKEIVSYLKRDCEALYELVTNFIERFGLNLTLAGTALKEIKKTGYEVPSTSDLYDNKFRQFYYGGRVQVFKAGSFYAKDEPFLYVDINSAYPRAMIDNHWYGTEYFSTKELPELNKLGPCMVSLVAIAEGCLPFRGDDNKLYFPTDEKQRVYNVTGWEIISGLKTNTLKIIEVKYCYRPVLTNNFESYISRWFNEKADAKKSGDTIGYLIAKLMQNSGYGKFGQNGREFAKFCILPLGEWPDILFNKHGEQLPRHEQWQFHSDTETGYTFFKRPDPSYRFFNVPVAASITGWVRAYLWEHIHSSEGVMYCDTDSLICEKFNGKTGDKLGEWEVEALLSEAHIAQRKMYACRVSPVTEKGPVNKVKIASKGVRLSFNELKTGVENRSVFEYERDAPSFSIRFGTRFISREINFENIDKNTCTNPE